MKRLDHDITLTMLNSIRFAVYFHNILSLKSMSWPVYNYYTEDRFRIHASLLHAPSSWARHVISGSWSFSVLAFQRYSVSKNLVFLQTERRAMLGTNCWHLRSLITVTLIPPFNFIDPAGGRRIFPFSTHPSPLPAPSPGTSESRLKKKRLLCRLLNCWLTLKLKWTKLHINCCSLIRCNILRKIEKFLKSDVSDISYQLDNFCDGESLWKPPQKKVPSGTTPLGEFFIFHLIVH